MNSANGNSSTGSKKGKVSRKKTVIPQLIFEIEKYEGAMLKYSKDSSVCHHYTSLRSQMCQHRVTM